MNQKAEISPSKIMGEYLVGSIVLYSKLDNSGWFPNRIQNTYAFDQLWGHGNQVGKGNHLNSWRHR